MSEISKLTDAARDYNNEGQDTAHIIYNVTEEVVEKMQEEWGIDLTPVQATAIENALHEPVRDSIAWDILEQDDESAREWEDAKRSAIYK